MFNPSVYHHKDIPGAGAKKRRGLGSKDMAHAIMGEFKRGTLRSGGSGKHVKSRAQAKAILMSVTKGR
jgi:hypothetical protein